MKGENGFLGSLLLIAAVVLPLSSEAAAEPAGREKRWELRTGYGYQYTNSTRPTHFQITPLLVSLAVPISDQKGASGYRGRFEWNPELFLAVFSHPYVRPLAGVTPLQFSYAFEPEGRLSPYAGVGTGILWANINRRETRKDLNFNIQGFVGTRYGLSDRVALILEYRHIHISNAGLHEDNAGLNTHTFLAGISFKE